MISASSLLLLPPEMLYTNSRQTEADEALYHGESRLDSETLRPGGGLSSRKHPAIETYNRSQNGQRKSYYFGIMVLPWYWGAMVLQYYGTMAPQCHSAVALGYYGTMVIRYYDNMVLWYYGTMVIWYYGNTVL